jgi:hypothetical protein
MVAHTGGSPVLGCTKGSTRWRREPFLAAHRRGQGGAGNHSEAAQGSLRQREKPFPPAGILFRGGTRGSWRPEERQEHGRRRRGEHGASSEVLVGGSDW